MTWFWPFDSFDPVPVVLLQLKMRERKNRTVTVIFDPASVTAEFEVWIHRNYGETVGVNRSGTRPTLTANVLINFGQILWHLSWGTHPNLTANILINSGQILRHLSWGNSRPVYPSFHLSVLWAEVVSNPRCLSVIVIVLIHTLNFWLL